MAIAASSVLPSNSLEDFRLEFNNLVSDVTGITATNKFDENIIFEGSTADAFETTLTVTDPTADRTLTLPNATDTLVGLATTDTLTNKTLTTPVIAEIDSGSTITLDATTDIVLDADGGDVFFKDDGTTFGSATNSSGNLIIKSGTTTAATFSGANVTLAGTLGVGAVTGTSTIQGTTITATTAFVPDASDGAALGTSALEFSDLFLADGAVINLGDDQDVTLNHVADTGILLNSTMQLQFNDSSQFINAPTNAILDINATDEIELNATLADVNANLDVSGTFTGGGLMTTGGNIVIPNDGNIGSVGDTDAIAISSAGVVTFSQTPVFSGDSTFSDDISLSSDGAVINFGADSEVTLTHVHNMGLTLNSDNHLRFGDAGTYIHQSADGVLDLVSDNEVEINGTTIDINGAVEISGATTQTGISTSAAKDVFNAGLSVKNGSTSAGFIEFFEDSDNGTNKVTLIGPSSTSDVTITLPSSSATLATSGDITALAIALG